jgi:phosphatidylglycerophosphatase A
VPLGARLLATGGFAGYLPWAPGTAGSLLGLALVLVPGATDAFVHLSLIVALAIAGARAADLVARVDGHRLTPAAERTKALFQPGAHALPDPSVVVIDEIVGMLTALLFLPDTAAAYACAFLLFRGFDIIKPPPARQLERVPHGWGIMLDDVAAGIYANILTQVIVRLAFPLLGW